MSEMLMFLITGNKHEYEWRLSWNLTDKICFEEINPKHLFQGKISLLFHYKI